MKLTTKSAFYLSLLSFLSFSSFAAPKIKDKIDLVKGWNAIYVESTPDDPSCEAIFANCPAVKSVGVYRSDADAATAQYDANGKEIVQKPVVYLQWIRGESASTLKSITGGYTYLVYSEGQATVSFEGVPSVPRMTWRKVLSTDVNEIFNLAGVSLPEGNDVSAAAYFGEGPFGTEKAGQAIYGIGGTDPKGPELVKIATFGRAPKVGGCKAYALTATKAGDWPGVIGFDGRPDLNFAPGVNYASFKLRNRGTKTHTYTIKAGLSEEDLPDTYPAFQRRLPRTDAISDPGFTNVEQDVAWQVTLEPDEVSEQVFRIDRSQLVSGTTYGALLTISEADTKMRVRLPVVATPDPDAAVKYPTGLWSGEIALSQVSQITDVSSNLVPVAAGGLLKMNVLLFVDPTKKQCKLLQRVVTGVDASGAPRLFKELSDVPQEVGNPKRVSTVMMSVDTPVVAQANTDEFGQSLVFDWTVAPKARDNPFRHAWHPDHDGKKADYSGDLPAGDDFSLYANPVKPELWSVSNRLEFSWHKLNNPGEPYEFGYMPDEVTAGYVNWEVTGLIAHKPIKSVGTFTLKRVVKAKEME